MAFTNKAYTTVDDVKAAMDSTTTANDDLLQAFIGQAQAYIDEYLGFSFQTDGTAASPATRTYDGNGGEQLLIDRCLNLVSVKTQGYTISTQSDGSVIRTLNTARDISGDCFLGPMGLDAGFIVERQTGFFPLGKRNIVVTGVFGQSATIPADIKRAATRLAIHFMKQVDANYQNQVGGGQLGVPVFTQDIPSDVCAILDRRKPRIFRAR